MRRGTIAGWLLLGGFAAVGGIVLAWQQQATAQLRHELALAREEHREAARLRAERERATAAQGSAAELSALRADRAALGRLRSEIEMLKTRMDEIEQAPAADTITVTSPPATSELIPASTWENAGRATPKATLETALWAAVGGDIDVLADTISLDAGARAKAEAILAGLPAAARTHYASPEKLVALLTAKDVPEGASMRVVAQSGTATDEARLYVVLQGEKATRGADLALRRHAGNWKLVVPESAVEKYGAMLKDEAAIAGGVR
ncbi:MAG: hypothetical protein HY736_25750 [Verrucomicrobia bacterium]|nr:hypothetical protein [Verrucomicrobiota bacterium]